MYPLATIDFEATSLDPNSVPIEVGIAVATTSAGPITTWSALIRPPDDWNPEALWDPDAAKVLGIHPRHLRDGITPGAAVRALNEILRGVQRVWCGDGKYDLLWLDRLCEAAVPLVAEFQVAPVSDLLAACPGASVRVAAELKASPATHRAGPDAEMLCRAARRACVP